MGETTEKHRAGALPSERGACDELQCYTLCLGDEAFLHQNVVDAWTAQHADAGTKPIALAFALVGLYLHVEGGFSGRQVQRVHMALARHRKGWPSFALPRERGSVTANQVIATAPGPERDRAIEAWCASVWETFRESRQAVVELLELHGLGGAGPYFTSSGSQRRS